MNQRQHWSPEDRIDGHTLDEHHLYLVAKLGLSKEQRALLVEELRAALDGTRTYEAGKGIERALALADALEHAPRVTAHLGQPTRTNAMRNVLRAQGEAWLTFKDLARLAVPHCTPGTSTKDLNDSFRTMVNTGEVEHDGSSRGSRRYRLARRT